MAQFGRSSIHRLLSLSDRLANSWQRDENRLPTHVSLSATRFKTLPKGLPLDAVLRNPLNSDLTPNPSAKFQSAAHALLLHMSHLEEILPVKPYLSSVINVYRIDTMVSHFKLDTTLKSLVDKITIWRNRLFDNITTIRQCQFAEFSKAVRISHKRCQ